MRGRFAPSPTGDLHLGGALVAIASYLRVRARGAGAYVVRVEDLDPPRIVAGAEARIFEDLAWLGVTSDEDPHVGGPYGPYRQSERGENYRTAIAALEARGLVYPCTCSRAEIARASSAPHEGEEGPRYPGTCRDPARRRSDRAAALRVRLPDDATIAFEDLACGAIEQDVAATVGD
ncbi:MAG: glutamate--tRNA ligase family protein, partial [Polyangiales bacterium]